MHKVAFYPVGNGDTSQIILANGKRVLMDYRHLASSESGDVPEINLKEHLLAELKDAKKSSFDVVALTHGDSDHICGSTDFFELRHATKYQGDGRVKIDELWVPAAMILEPATKENQADEVIIWRQEARYRLARGEGIRVFSRPDKLKDWLTANELTLESRQHLITDAGQVVPGFTLDADGVEFFCHSPFVKHVNDGDDLRNPCALIFNVRFRAGANEFDYLAIGDSEFEVLDDIVATTKLHGNEDRLRWDLYNIPHHCSYRAIGPEKGNNETTPTVGVKELLLSGKEGSYVVSSSHPIEDNDDARDQMLPPHIQAKKCYERYLREVDGAQFLVTMEEPSRTSPEPLIFIIASDGITRDKIMKSAPAIIMSRPAPRAG